MPRSACLRSRRRLRLPRAVTGALIVIAIAALYLFVLSRGAIL
jgi:hypothetical protein